MLTVFVCEMHEMRTCAPCRGLQGFMLFLLFFRHLKVTLDSEQPKEERIIPSVRGGINVGFEHFQRDEYFSDYCAFEF